MWDGISVLNFGQSRIGRSSRSIIRTFEGTLLHARPALAAKPRLPAGLPEAMKANTGLHSAQTIYSRIILM
jgi:hypothetical protein